MKREAEFIAYLQNNKLNTKYAGYCKNHIEKAFNGKDMDEIIGSHQNISKVRTKLEAIEKSENSITQYMTALNHYLQFAFSFTKTTTSGFMTGYSDSLYIVSCAEGVPLTDEVEWFCQILENEYPKIIEFAKNVLQQGCFEFVPIIISDETPMHDSPDGGEKVLGSFLGSTKPYIEIYYRNFKPNDAAKIRNCLAHEYLHYLHYKFADSEFSDSPKGLTEGLADFFGVIYSIHRNQKDDLRVAQKRYERWEKYFGTYWPYADAIWFYRVHGKEMKYSSNYAKYKSFGCIGKFVQVFFSTHHPDDAYKAMKS